METLHSEKLSHKGSSAATQQFVEVSEIKEDVVILKNGSLRAILDVAAINFDLKSTDEQTAIIQQYQHFLNSLDFPIQILVNSKKFNIDQNLEINDKKDNEHRNELRKMQNSE